MSQHHTGVSIVSTIHLLHILNSEWLLCHVFLFGFRRVTPQLEAAFRWISRWLSMISYKMCQLKTFLISTPQDHEALCISDQPVSQSVQHTVRCTDYTKQTRRHRLGSQHVHHSNKYVMVVVCFCHTHTASPDWPGIRWAQLRCAGGASRYKSYNGQIPSRHCCFV